MQTNTYRMDKQQGLTVEPRELYSISCDKPYGKNTKKNIYFGHLMQRADSLEKTLMLGKIEGKRRRG